MKEHIREDSQTIAMKADEATTLYLSAKNHAEQERPLGNVPVWTTTDGSMVTLHPSKYGYECVVKGTMKVGQCKVIVEAQGSTGKIARTINMNLTTPYADVLHITQGPVMGI